MTEVRRQMTEENELGYKNAEIGMSKGRAVDCNTAYRYVKIYTFFN